MSLKGKGRTDKVEVSAEDAAKALAMHKAGKTNQAISEELGVGDYVTRRILVATGEYTPSRPGVRSKTGHRVQVIGWDMKFCNKYIGIKL